MSTRPARETLQRAACNLTSIVRRRSAAAERAKIDEEKRKAREERFKVQPVSQAVVGSKRQSSIPLEQEEPVSQPSATSHHGQV